MLAAAMGGAGEGCVYDFEELAVLVEDVQALLSPMPSAEGVALA